MSIIKKLNLFLMISVMLNNNSQENNKKSITFSKKKTIIVCSAISLTILTLIGALYKIYKINNSSNLNTNPDVVKPNNPIVNKIEEIKSPNIKNPAPFSHEKEELLTETSKTFSPEILSKITESTKDIPSLVKNFYQENIYPHLIENKIAKNNYNKNEDSNIENLDSASPEVLSEIKELAKNSYSQIINHLSKKVDEVKDHYNKFQQSSI